MPKRPKYTVFRWALAENCPERDTGDGWMCRYGQRD
jgi:hypothetical protein